MKHSRPESYTLVQSPSDCNYLLSSSAKELMLIHPALGLIIDKYSEGYDIPEWLESLGENKQELQYYYNYFLFLKANGYFEDVEKRGLHEKETSAGMMEYFFTNTDRVALEVTESCNLDCTYCGLGDLYQQDIKRTGKHLPFATAKRLIDYLWEQRNRKNFIREFKELTFSFYGGEPLLNFPLVEKLVSYINSLDWKTAQIKFRITTNGVLLEKHIDYLVQHDFILVVSLDGNKDHNSYRVYKDGDQSFAEVSAGIDRLRKKYPAYFTEKVKFNTVIHSKNSKADASEFFRDTYNKEPSYIAMTPTNVNPDRTEDFKQIYPQRPGNTEKKISTVDLYTLLLDVTNNVINNYRQLLTDHKNKILISTATCNPFKSKIFLTAGGDLLPCEKIPPKYALGKVDPEKVMLDYQKAADKYNSWYNHLSRLCNTCCKAPKCAKCMFCIQFDADPPTCDEYHNRERYNNFLKDAMGVFEKHPGQYVSLLKEGR